MLTLACTVKLPLNGVGGWGEDMLTHICRSSASSPLYPYTKKDPVTATALGLFSMLNTNSPGAVALLALDCT
jgi:hypothetical protein